MGETGNLGSRIELVPMDGHFRDISIGLYKQESAAGPGYLIHTYSSKDGVAGRMDAIGAAMVRLGGIQKEADGLLRFPCGKGHERACRRLFIESVKQSPSEDPEARPLEILDKKSGLTMTLAPLSEGVFRVECQGESESRERRIATVAGGLAKLGDLTWSQDSEPDLVRFPCGHDHTELAGLLLIRAPNVRAVLREEESTASRGVLAAPSQQKS